MQYWTHLFTYQTWQEFLQSGGQITGFPERRWNQVQQLQPHDLILCYLMGISRYIGVLVVTGEPFLGYKPIWAERLYPARVPVRLRLELLPEYGVPVASLAHDLSYFQNLNRPQAWTIHFRHAPIPETPADGQMILNTLELASEDPTYREFDPRKLESRHKIYDTQNGVVTIPENRPLILVEEAEDFAEEAEENPITHEEMQWLLLQIGSRMGLDVWAARNDRGRSFKGEPFAQIDRLLSELPRQFDPATQRTIELIDVLWLQKNAILAAFEVEHTSAVYSGLLRMADLLAMQPNLHIRLYIVAPDERREKVFGEINRPAFVKLNLNRLCQYLPYSALKQKTAQVWDVLPHLRPDFLHDIAESVEADD